MGLYDDENNEGICDCLELTGEKAKSELRPIYSDETGVCHQQNTQVTRKFNESCSGLNNSVYLTIKRAPVKMENGSYWRTLRGANRFRTDAQLTVGTSTGIPTLPRPNNAGRYGLKDHAMTGNYYICIKTRKSCKFTAAFD
jgi:hypothetical protein